MPDDVPNERSHVQTELTAIPKPAPSWLCMSTRLDHLTVVTWAVEPARLRRHVPPVLELVCVSLNGEEVALVSAVTFLNQHAHLMRIPTPRLSFGQTNYRVYVRHRGTRAVYFLGTTIDSWGVVVPNVLWKMPWRRSRYRFVTVQEGAHGGRLTVTAQGVWGMRLVVLDEGEGPGTLDGFSSTEEGLHVLTQPHIGYYPRGKTRMGRYTIWHDFYQPRHGSLLEARFDLLDALDVVPVSQQRTPHSIIMEPSVQYWIHLPPRPWHPLDAPSNAGILDHRHNGHRGVHH